MTKPSDFIDKSDFGRLKDTSDSYACFERFLKAAFSAVFPDGPEFVSLTVDGDVYVKAVMNPSSYKAPAEHLYVMDERFGDDPEEVDRRVEALREAAEQAMHAEGQAVQTALRSARKSAEEMFQKR
jgi:hypothetical protein